MATSKPPNSRFFLPGSFRSGVPELVDRSFYLAWLNSDEPNKLLKEKYGEGVVDTLQDIRQAFALRAAAIAEANKAELDAPGAVVNPLAGADLVSAFMFGAKSAVMCDMAPFFYEQRDDTKDKRDAYDFIRNLLQLPHVGVMQLLVGTAGGYDNIGDYRDGFSDEPTRFDSIGKYPPGHLGLLRLKFLLGAQDLQVMQSDSEGWVIKFNVIEVVDGKNVKSSRQINYFDRTYFPDLMTELDTLQKKDTSGPFLEYLKSHKTSFVLLKAAHDFCLAESAREFWFAVKSKYVVSDDLMNWSGHTLPFPPFRDIDLKALAKRHRGQPFLSKFGYSTSIQFFLVSNFKDYFAKKTNTNPSSHRPGKV